VVKRAQALMQAMDHQPRCGQCADYSDLQRLRLDRGLTIPEAAAQLGLSARGFHRHMLWPYPSPVIVVKLPGFFRPAQSF
jgi:hypothetical protein